MRDRALGHPLLKVAVKFEPDIVTARQKTRRLAQLLGFDSHDQARLATAVSELARNVFQYAGSGSIEFFFAEQAPQTFFIKVSDSGPGIAALNEILAGTYVSKSGMGVGLIGTKKLMDSFAIDSKDGKGTVITIGKALGKRKRPIDTTDLNKLVAELTTSKSANAFEEMQNQNRELLDALEEIGLAKAALDELNRELAETNRGVVALYAELDEKADSLQRANDVKTRFLSNMTHEFRTPLSSIISLTRLLLSGVDGELTPEQEKQVNYIQQSSVGLLELVSDLLDLAKVEAGKVSISANPFEVEEVLSSLRGVFRPLVHQSGDLDFYVDLLTEPFELKTDQAKISQVLRNLVSNALKFTERGSIRVTAALEPSGFAHFTVTDTGIGIAPESHDLIFEDFSQVESALHHRQRGTGLGLPLSRKLAQLLGGDLWVESAVGKGSSFHVAIPRVYAGGGDGVLIAGASRGSKEAATVAATSPESSGRFRVLMIDDDEPSRYVLRSLVARELDADFHEASDGESGLASIQQSRPDIVFLDLAMPNLSGFDVLRSLRHDTSLKDLPVVINTAKALSKDEREFLEREATAVLSKDRPDDLAALVALRAALAKSGFDYKSK